MYQSVIDEINSGEFNIPEPGVGIASESHMKLVESRFMVMGVLGSGTYGEVSRAKDRATGAKRALKKLKIKNGEGMRISVVREMMILKELCHENIVKMYEMCYGKEKNGDYSIFMVLELCRCDLHNLIQNSGSLTIQRKKCIMQQVLLGLNYMHSLEYIHRDIKPANILVSESGMLRLSDMGLSRHMSTPKHGVKDAKYTTNVVTLWYRSPELLLGMLNYGLAVDVWSLGCVFVELWLRAPLFPGRTDLDQLGHITRRCGGINSESWPDAGRLLETRGFRESHSKPSSGDLRSSLARKGFGSSSALNLVVSMFAYNPAERISTAKALEHVFFTEKPLAHSCLKF